MIWAMVVLPIILLVMGMPIFTVLMAAASVALIYVLEFKGSDERAADPA